MKGLLSPVGRIKLRRMLKDGFPPELHSPLLYLLTRNISKEEEAVFERIESLRRTFQQQPAELQVLRGTAGPGGSGEAVQVARDLDWLQQIVSVPKYWGAFLHLCAKASQAKTILELGSCLGISGCYLASANSSVDFITIEGSKDLVPIAQSNLQQIAGHAKVIPALFEDGLDRVLPAFRSGLDVVHIDGDHTEEKTLHYFRRLIPHLHTGSIVLFDDIYFSPGMLSAWEKLSRWEGASFAVNLGRFGMLIWEGGAREPQAYDLSLFTSEWGRGATLSK